MCTVNRKRKRDGANPHHVELEIREGDSATANSEINRIAMFPFVSLGWRGLLLG